ncbi:MAG: glycoside hydrolase [Oscillospiraceae bacterium]|nr:glycoside hydrolase [Oscillospiraceae bacterium]
MGAANKAKYPPLPIAEAVDIACERFPTAQASLPKGYRVDEGVGLVCHEAMSGRVVYRAAREMYEVRATVTPGGDYLTMFPAGGHYGANDRKSNTMTALRSSDKGETWSDPYVAFNIDYNQHGFIPLIPRGSKRIYSFGTQPVWGHYTRDFGLAENAPIGYLYSDDDGYTWAGPVLIDPINDPGFTGMSVMRMCETDKGTWLIGSHDGYHWDKPATSTYLYILRSEDQGKTWEALPDRRKNGWNLKPYNRMDEGRPIQVGDRILFICRTPEGHLWARWSSDDGRTWTDAKPTSLVHPDAPPMICHLSDGKTLVCFHHNRFHDKDYTGLRWDKGAENPAMGDRSEVWAAISKDCGETWGEPVFVYCNAVRHDAEASPFFNNQCSYNDLFMDGDTLNVFVPHLWRQALHLRIKESDLLRLPTRAEIIR